MIAKRVRRVVRKWPWVFFARGKYRKEVEVDKGGGRSGGQIGILHDVVISRRSRRPRRGSDAPPAPTPSPKEAARAAGRNDRNSTTATRKIIGALETPALGVYIDHHSALRTLWGILRRSPIGPVVWL